MRVAHDEVREEYRMLHLERLERMFANVFPYTLRRRSETGVWLPPDEKMAAQAIRLLEREARLLGLDAPQRVAISADQQETYQAAIVELRRVLEARQEPPSVVQALAVLESKGWACIAPNGDGVA